MTEIKQLASLVKPNHFKPSQGLQHKRKDTPDVLQTSLEPTMQTVPNSYHKRMVSLILLDVCGGSESGGRFSILSVQGPGYETSITNYVVFRKLLYYRVRALSLSLRYYDSIKVLAAG